MADEARPAIARGENPCRVRSRGRPRVRSPESARRFQRECIRQMQATRVYLGTAYQRWRSLSFLFKRTSDMAKHLLDVHERHCTTCYHAPYVTLAHSSPLRRTHDNTRFLSEYQKSPMLRSQLQKSNSFSHPSTSCLPAKDDTEETVESPSPSVDDDDDGRAQSEGLRYIKSEPESDVEECEEAIDLSRDGSGSSSEHPANTT